MALNLVRVQFFRDFTFLELLCLPITNICYIHVRNDTDYDTDYHKIKGLFDLENLESELKPVIEEEREWIEKTEQRQIKLEEYSRQVQFDLNEQLRANREQAEKDFKDLQASKEKYAFELSLILHYHTYLP